MEQGKRENRDKHRRGKGRGQHTWKRLSVKQQPINPPSLIAVLNYGTLYEN